MLDASTFGGLPEAAPEILMNPSPPPVRATYVRSSATERRSDQLAEEPTGT
jgi:hypothetical protein